MDDPLSMERAVDDRCQREQTQTSYRAGSVPAEPERGGAGLKPRPEESQVQVINTFWHALSLCGSFHSFVYYLLFQTSSNY